MTGAGRASEAVAGGESPVKNVQKLDSTLTLHGTLPPYLSLTDTECKWVLLSIMLSRFLTVLDASIVAVSLPNILEDLGNARYVSWLIASNLLTTAAILPLTGRLSDIVGRRPVYICSLFVFLASSVACGASNSLWFLVAARAIQGLGCGGLNAMSMIIAGDITAPEKRAGRIAILGSSAGLATIVGPVVGGVLSQYANWRWIFYINLPFGILSFFAGLFSMQRLETPTKRLPMDWFGCILSLAAVVCLVLFLTWGGNDDVGYPWASNVIIGLIVSAALLTAVFIAWELRHPLPIIQIRLHGVRNVWTMFTVGFIAYYTMILVLNYLPIYFKVTQGDRALMRGLKSLGFAAGFMITAQLCGKYCSKLKRGNLVMGASALLTCCGMAVLSTIDANTNYGILFAGMFMLGLASGWQIPGTGAIVQQSVAQRDISVATSNLSFDFYMGGTIGMAVSGAVYNISFTKALQHGHQHIDAAAEAVANVFYAGIFPSIIAAICGFLLKPLIPEGSSTEDKTDIPAAKPADPSNVPTAKEDERKELDLLRVNDKSDALQYKLPETGSKSEVVEALASTV